MLYSVKLFFERIKRIFNWIPMLWKIWDFDYQSSIDVFIFQLENIAAFLESSKSYSASADVNASQIRRTVSLMKQVYDEKFSMEYYEYLEEKYGKKQQILSRFGNEFGKTAEEIKNINEEEMTLFLASKKKQEKAHKLVWKLIENNIQRWWD